MGIEAYIIIVETALLAGLVPAFIASAKGRQFLPWWIYGALALVIALPHALLARAQSDHDETEPARQSERQECPVCGENLPAHAVACRYCGASLDGSPRWNGAGAKVQADHPAEAKSHQRPEPATIGAAAGPAVAAAAASARMTDRGHHDNRGHHDKGQQDVPPAAPPQGASGPLPWSDADFARLSANRSNGARQQPRFAPVPPERGTWSRESVGIAAVSALMIVGFAFLGYRVLIPDQRTDLAALDASRLAAPTDPARQPGSASPPQTHEAPLSLPPASANPPAPENGAAAWRQHAEPVAMPRDPRPDNIGATDPLRYRPLPVPPDLPQGTSANTADGTPEPLPVARGTGRGLVSLPPRDGADTDAEPPPDLAVAAPPPALPRPERAALTAPSASAAQDSQDTAAPAPAPRTAARTPSRAPVQLQRGGAGAQQLAAKQQTAKQPAAPQKREPASDPENEVTAVGELVYWIQERLADLGHFHGQVNGRAGPETRKAITAYQRAQGLTPNGHINEALIVSLRRASGGTAQKAGTR